MIPESKFIEIVDLLLDILYDEDREINKIDIDLFLDEYAHLQLNHREKWLFTKRLKESKMGYRISTQDGDFTNFITITNRAVEIIYSHGTYSKYIGELKAEEEKKQRDEQKLKTIEKRDKIASIWNNFSGVVYGAIGIVVTILTIRQEVHLSQLDKHIKDQTTKMDSILKAVGSLQKQPLKK